ncbi:hypothetical protein LEP1GSC066_0583 [Leptospira sp. serovar Kenya str. Sh9]|nr:hypothetical protein LEP1GSC066_0583 [Leptospira sp. serovar Kenya str. Sh9]
MKFFNAAFYSGPIFFGSVLLLEPVSKLSSVGAALPRLCPQSSECESFHRNRRIGGFLPSFKIVIAPTS